jgi:tetratricopeptide (TPR) repeat protein
MAKAFMVKQQYQAAISELHLAIQQNPTGAAEHRVLGQALLIVGKNEEAVKELRTAVALSPDSDLAHHYLGTALFQLQDFAAAEKEFRQAVQLKSTADNHYSLAACLMSLSRNGEALAELEIASHLDPEEKLYRARKEELVRLMNGNPR